MSFFVIVKKIIKILFYTASFVVIADGLVLFFFSVYEPQVKKADAIIVLGAAINSPALINRTEHGLRLYEKGLADKIIVSGGKISEDDPSEAEFMKKLIEKRTKDKPNIIVEDKATSTFENLKYAHELVPGAQSIVIVSDKFHLARATLVAWRNGYWPVYWSAPAASPYDDEEQSWYYAREFMAMLAYIPKFIVN